MFYLRTVLTWKNAPLRVDLPLVAAEGVLVPQDGAADVALGGLLLVGAVDVGLGAELGAVGADQLDVGLPHVLLQVPLGVEHLAALLAGPVVLSLLRVIVAHVLLEVPRTDIQ